MHQSQFATLSILLALLLASCTDDTTVLVSDDCPTVFHAGEMTSVSYTNLDSLKIEPVITDSVDYTGSAKISLDLNGDGADDIELVQYQNFSAPFRLEPTLVYRTASALNDSLEIGTRNGHLAMLTAGEDVKHDSLWANLGTGVGSMLHYLNTWPGSVEYGNWNGHGFLPIRIHNNGTTYYWISMHIFRWDNFTIYGYAKECTDQPG